MKWAAATPSDRPLAQAARPRHRQRRLPRQPLDEDEAREGTEPQLVAGGKGLAAARLKALLACIAGRANPRAVGRPKV